MIQPFKYYEDLGVFKRLKANKAAELKLIIKFLIKQKKGVRSSEIATEIGLTKAIVDSRLVRLKKVKQLDIIGANMKYLKDNKDGSASFPGEISNKTKEHLGYMYQDAISRQDIKKIILEKIKKDYNLCLTPLTFTNMDIFLNCVESVVGERNLLQLYHSLFESINEVGLYDPLLCRYGELQRQRRANRYLLKK